MANPEFVDDAPVKTPSLKAQDATFVDDAEPLQTLPAHQQGLRQMARPVPDVLRSLNQSPTPIAPPPGIPEQGLMEGYQAPKGLGKFQDILRAPVAAGQAVIHGTAETLGKAALVWDRVASEYPNFTRLVHQSFPGIALSASTASKVAPMKEVAEDVVNYNKRWRASEDKALTDKLGVNKESGIGQAAEFAGGIAGGVAKAAALGPAALPYFAAEGGVDKAVESLDKGKPLGRSLAAGGVSALTAATIMNLAGGSGEKAYDSLLKMAAAKVAKGTQMGLAFGAADLAVDKWVLKQDMTPQEVGASLLNSVKTMLGYELAGAIPEAKMIREGQSLGKEYASPDDARAAIVPKLTDAYAAGDKAEVDSLYSQMQSIAYAEQAGIPFKGKRTLSMADDVHDALTVANAANPEEVRDAVEKGQIQESNQGEYPGGGPLRETEGNVREPEGISQRVDAVNRGGGLQEGREVPQEEVDRSTAFNDLPQAEKDKVHQQMADESKALAEDPEGTVKKYQDLPETNGGRIVNGDSYSKLLGTYAENPNRGHAGLETGEVSTLTNNMKGMNAVRDAAVSRAVEEGKDAVITVGGNGSGKTTAANHLLEKNPQIGVVIDSPHADPEELIKTIRSLRSKGIENVSAIFVDADPKEAFRRTLTRSAGPEGRHIDPGHFVETHYGSPKAAEAVGREFRNEPNIGLFHLTPDLEMIGGDLAGEGKGAVASIRERQAWTKEDIDAAAREAYLEERSKGNVPEDAARSIEAANPSYVQQGRVSGPSEAAEPGNRKVNPRTGPEERSPRDTGRPDAVQVERRKDQATRKRVDQMSSEEKDRALHMDDMTGLNNRRWWEDNESKGDLGKHIALMDGDSQKWVNDNLGYKAGDELIQTFGEALKSAGLGDRAARWGGDEFKIHGDDPKELETSMQKAKDYMKEHPIQAKLADGTEIEFTGGFSHGIGENEDRAEEAEKADKSRRTQAGERAERGNEPPGVRRKVSGLSMGRDQREAVPKSQEEEVRTVAQQKADEYRAPVKSAIPGPGSRDARAEAYRDPAERNLIEQIQNQEQDPFRPSRGAVGPRLPKVKVPEGKKGRNLLSKAATHIAKSAVETFTDLGDPLSGSQADAFQNVAHTLYENGQLQMLHQKGQDLPDMADSWIEPTLPKGEDLPGGKLRQFGRYWTSPRIHNKLTESFTLDRFKSSLDRIMKQAAGTQWAHDVLSKTPDASAAVQREMSPIAREIFKVNAQLEPLESSRRKLQADILNARRKAVRAETDKAERAAIRAALEKGGPGSRAEKAKLTEDQLRGILDRVEKSKDIQDLKNRLVDFDAKNKDRMDSLKDQRKAHYAKADTQLRSLAQKHADVRVAMLVDSGIAPPDWLHEIVTKEDVSAAYKIEKGMANYRDSLKKRGIPVIEDPYLTHLLRPLDPERFELSQTPEGQSRIRKLLAFQHRQGDMNLFPTAHGSLSAYIPTVSRKIADQPLLDKWADNPYADETSDLYAPQFGHWLGQNIRDMQNPRKQEPWEPIANAVKRFEMLRTIAFSPRVAVKHMVKMTNLLGLHHSWLLPAAKDVAAHYARRAENVPLINSAMKKMGMTPEVDPVPEALSATLMATKQLAKTLYEDPLVADYEDPVMNKYLDPGTRAWANPLRKMGRKAIDLGGYPVTAVEAMENYLNVFASTRRGQAAGLKPMQNVNATLLNILDYNYRSGADAAKYLKSPALNTAFMFTMTPAKGLELQSRILSKGMSGERDIYGSLETSHLIRHMVAVGTILAVAKKYGHDLIQDVLHVPVLGATWSANMAKAIYYDAMGNKRLASKHLNAAAGDYQGAISLSPVLGVGSDFYAMAMALHEGSLAPIEGQTGFTKQAQTLLSDKTPKGFKDKAHYLTDSPTPKEEKKREREAEARGKKVLGRFRKLVRQDKREE